jgi:hypothetical protein
MRKTIFQIKTKITSKKMYLHVVHTIYLPLGHMGSEVIASQFLTLTLHEGEWSVSRPCPPFKNIKM